MERWAGRVALVTGCSSGIGEQIARTLVRSGMRVVGCARRVHKVHELSAELVAELSAELGAERGAELGAERGAQRGSLTAFECDLRREEDIARLFAFIEAEFGRIDVCVNNAGFSSIAPLLEAETALWREMLEVNVLAVAACTREAFKLMTKKGIDDGQIINISSMCGHRIDPLSTVTDAFYSVTKHAVRCLTEATRIELRRLDTHIRIAELSPGYTETNFHVAQRGESGAKEAYTQFKCLEASDIADMVKYVISAPPHVQINDILVRATEQLR